MKLKKFRHRLFILQRLASGLLHRMLGSLNKYLQPEQRYSIKPGYHHARAVEAFDDRQNTDQWQMAVYETALTRLKEMEGKTVIDVGCGSAYKLISLFGAYQTTGIELQDTHHWLTEKYPGKKWMAFGHAETATLTCDLVICSDVIEHVEDPDGIMNFLKKINFSCLVLSTPERNSVRGARDFGPPENTSHYREWNQQEFKHYVSQWFTVNEQIISQDKSASQILVCTQFTQ